MIEQQKRSAGCCSQLIANPPNIRLQQEHTRDTMTSTTMSSMNTEEESTSKRIVVRKTFRCTLGEMWAKWSTAEGLKSFFGADNNIKLAEGGAYEIFFKMDSPEGLRGGEGNKIISYVRQSNLAFTWNAPPEFPTVRNHEKKTWVLVEFNKIDDCNVEVVLTHVGWLEGEDWDAVYEYFSRAWETVMSWLETSLEGFDFASSAPTAFNNIDIYKRFPFMAETKAGADEMRAIALDENEPAYVVRANELETTARQNVFSLLTDGYRDEHH